MSNPPGQVPARSGLSLYANLLDPSSSTTAASISRAPVVFQASDNGGDDGSAKKQQVNAGRYISPFQLQVCMLLSDLLTSGFWLSMNSCFKIPAYKTSTTFITEAKVEVGVSKSYSTTYLR
jgi:hypothetical protein